MTSDHTSYAAGFQRPREDNLTVLLLRRPSRTTLTAEEATNNSCPEGPADLGRGFYRDFAQPSQVVRDGTAAPDSTKARP